MLSAFLFAVLNITDKAVEENASRILEMLSPGKGA